MAKITLAAARTNAGMTQQEIADKMGVSRSSVIKWENGKTEMKTVYLIAFCQITGFDVNDILLPKKESRFGRRPVQGVQSDSKK